MNLVKKIIKINKIEETGRRMKNTTIIIIMSIVLIVLRQFFCLFVFPFRFFFLINFPFTVKISMMTNCGVCNWKILFLLFIARVATTAAAAKAIIMNLEEVSLMENFFYFQLWSISSFFPKNYNYNKRNTIF